jgi:hypothetical protein
MEPKLYGPRRLEAAAIEVVFEYLSVRKTTSLSRIFRNLLSLMTDFPFVTL